MNDRIKEQIGILKEEIAFLKDQYRIIVVVFVAIASSVLGILININIEKFIFDTHILFAIIGIIFLVITVLAGISVFRAIHKKFKKMKELINELS